PVPFSSMIAWRRSNGPCRPGPAMARNHEVPLRIGEGAMHRLKRWLAAIFMVALGLAGADAAEIRVAVASSCTAAAREIAAAFAGATGHEAVISFGATGQLYAQITQGAPFEILLAADEHYPARAVADGH